MSIGLKDILNRKVLLRKKQVYEFFLEFMAEGKEEKEFRSYQHEADFPLFQEVAEEEDVDMIISESNSLGVVKVKIAFKRNEKPTVRFVNYRSIDPR